jgi:hypothetical protein
MDYATQVRDLVIGDRYILSPELDVNSVHGGFERYARNLQNNYHTLEGKEEFISSPGIPYKVKLFFTKEYPEDFSYPTPLRIDIGYIPPGIDNLFLPDEDMAATKIKRFIRRRQAKNVQQRTLDELYAPGGIGYKMAEDNWRSRSGGSRKRKTRRARRTVKRQYRHVPKLRTPKGGS